MEVRSFVENEIIFIELEEVGVVLDGTVLMRSHKESIIAPNLLSKLRSGDIFGYSPIDRGMSKLHQNWFTAHSDCKIAFFSDHDFKNIWEAQKTTEKELMKSVLLTYDIFRQFSQQSLYLLCFELLQRRIYCQNEMVSVQDKRSPFNYRFSPIFENKVSNIAISLKRSQQQKIKQDQRQSFESINNSKLHLMAAPSNVQRKQTKMSFYTNNPSPMAQQSTTDHKFHPDQRGSVGISHGSRQGISQLIDEEITLDQLKVVSQPHIKVHVSQNQNLLSPGSSGVQASVLELDQDFDLDQQEKSGGIQMEKGIFIIEKGKALVVNPSDGYVVTELARGDFFGEEAYFHSKGFCHFGDVIAAEGDQALMCLFISAANLKRIPIWEIQGLRKFSLGRKSIQKISYTCELRAQKRKKT